MDRVYRITEIVATSEESIDEAVRHGVERASKTLKGLDWVEVGQVRGLVKDGKLAQFQVTMKIGFRLMTPEELHKD